MDAHLEQSSLCGRDAYGQLLVLVSARPVDSRHLTPRFRFLARAFKPDFADTQSNLEFHRD